MPFYGQILNRYAKYKVYPDKFHRSEYFYYELQI